MGKLKVVKVDTDKKEITVVTDDCQPEYIEPIVLPIWVGEVRSFDDLFGLKEEISKEELEKKYPKGGA